ncbi:RING-type E3 ubiquitin transferase [Malassezia cuniculi]|uniref:E3 ubiquitin protein ligase n=1 Tax=Malassezia cuniculi TaxID=948313 RepID=A0AAF0J868_9BASI|nr:RING-type E3 ubiquitin transferase [Malassezia cuniculi]
MFAGAKRVPETEAGSAAKRAHVDEAPPYDQLEAREARMRGSILAVNRFWDVMLEDLRVLHVDERLLADPRHRALSAAVQLVPDSDDLVAGLEERAQAAKSIFAALAAHGGAQAPPEAAAAAEARCHALAAEASTLRQAVSATNAALSEARERVEALTNELRAAERRADRATSGAVKAVENPGLANEPVEATRAPASTPAPAQTDAQMPDQPAPGADAEALAAATAEAHEASALASARLKEAEDLRSQLAESQIALDELRRQLHVVPDERVASHPLYHELNIQAMHIQQELERLRGECEALQAENDALREFRTEFQRQTATQANTHAEELQKQLRQRDADVVRLRGQRDELNAELLERRSRENVRFDQVDELKGLVSTKDERVETLRSQVKRLRLELAAVRGEADVAAELAAEKEVDAALESALATLRAENEQLRQGISPTKEALEALAAGPGGTASPEQVRARWEALQKEVETLKLQLRTSTSSTAALADEVDRLSAAYDALDKQFNTRVVNVARLEDKILRLTTEKSKADNKYFAAMRAKDALDAEKRAFARSTKRHNKVLERYAEVEKALGQQAAAAEQEVSTLRRALQTHAAALAEAERDRAGLRKRNAEMHKAKTAAEAAAAAQVKRAAEVDSALSRTEERAATLEREVGRLRRRLAESSAGTPGKKRDEDTPLDYLNSLLRCSACKERYRERVITRCMHTFCEPCVRARIETRQRKCPHCGIAFAVSDVQTLFLQ